MMRTLTGNLSRRTALLLLVGASGIAVAQGPPGRGPDDRGRDFRFRDQDRGRFAPHYSKDVDRWRRRPQGRPRFTRGQRIPNGIRFQAVPRSYYAGVPPPPPGYQYGYYDGYVVAYNPTTRIIADVLDLVATAAR
jgi:Ni/Co efflux regulator RcnB